MITHVGRLRLRGLPETLPRFAACVFPCRHCGQAFVPNACVDMRSVSRQRALTMAARSESILRTSDDVAGGTM